MTQEHDRYFNQPEAPKPEGSVDRDTLLNKDIYQQVYNRLLFLATCQTDFGDGIAFDFPWIEKELMLAATFPRLFIHDVSNAEQMTLAAYHFGRDGVITEEEATRIVKRARAAADQYVRSQNQEE